MGKVRGRLAARRRLRGGTRAAASAEQDGIVEDTGFEEAASGAEEVQTAESVEPPPSKGFLALSASVPTPTPPRTASALRAAIAVSPPRVMSRGRSSRRLSSFGKTKAGPSPVTWATTTRLGSRSAARQAYEAQVLLPPNLGTNSRGAASCASPHRTMSSQMLLPQQPVETSSGYAPPPRPPQPVPSAGSSEEVAPNFVSSGPVPSSIPGGLVWYTVPQQSSTDLQQQQQQQQQQSQQMKLQKQPAAGRKQQQVVQQLQQPPKGSQEVQMHSELLPMVERLVRHEIRSCREGVMEAAMAEVAAEREEIEKQMKKGWRACRESLLESIMAERQQVVARTESDWRTCRDELFASVGKEMATERSKIQAQVKELKATKDGIMESVMTEVEREWAICREGLMQGFLAEISTEQKESTDNIEQAWTTSLREETHVRKACVTHLEARLTSLTSAIGVIQEQLEQQQRQQQEKLQQRSPEGSSLQDGAEQQLLVHVEEALQVALQAEAAARNEVQNSLRGRIEAVTAVRENAEREILARMKEITVVLQDNFTRVTEHCDNRLKEERSVLHAKLRQQQENLEQHVALICEDVMRLVEGHSDPEWAGSNPRRSGSSTSRHLPAEGSCEGLGRGSAAASPVASDRRGTTSSGTSHLAVPRRSVVEDFHSALAAGSAASVGGTNN